VLVTFFSRAVKLGYATANPAAKTEKAKEVDSPPGILTVAQAANLLEQATSIILPHIAIGLFAGLRRAELERLDWSDVHFADHLIEVTAAKSKTRGVASSGSSPICAPGSPRCGNIPAQSRRRIS
jgi:integrase